MDKDTVSRLSHIVNDHINEKIKSQDAKRKINGILHNKKIATVVSELQKYVSKLSGKEKNIAILIVTMALIRRDLDDITKLKNAILKEELGGCLYGGLFTLFTGNSSYLSLTIKLNDSSYGNKYEFLTRFSDFGYWDYIEVFEAAKLLSLIEPHLFEKLALLDKTKLLLLNMVSHHLGIEPSESLIKKLLMDEDELKQNIGFYFITRQISMYLMEIKDMKRREINESYRGKTFNELEKFIKLDIKRCYDLIEGCDNKSKVSLITNFLLTHQDAYPIAFARQMVDSELQNEFAYQIKNSGKLRSLKEVAFITNLIKNTPAANGDNRRISKVQLYEAVAVVIISFIDEEKGIHIWGGQESNYMKQICQQLPKRFIKKIISYLNKKDKTLMCSKLDELVRFDIYLKDKKQHEIIEGILEAAKMI
ncbi:MAG: hypothetical protein M0P77_06620 [Firmicutes bacterium]|nr:hypothetical protein [Bacillota bacterium]